MKFTLTIQDLSGDEARSVLDRLEGQPAAVKLQETPTAPVAAPVLSAPPVSTVDDENEEPEAVDDSELDVDGLPWDARIHSSNHEKTAKGVWRRRRGVQDSEFDAIAAELKGEGVPAFAKPPATFQPPATPAPVAAPKAAPKAAPVPAPAAATQANVETFEGLISHVSELFRGGKIGPNYPQTIVDRINGAFQSDVKTITDVGNDNNMVQYAWACIKVDKEAGVIG